jgi:rubrerythrin
VELREALLEAFSAASQTRERYEVFAARAEAQRFPQIARLFRAAARGESLHAQRHLKAAREVGAVEANLRTALYLEGVDVERRYPSHRQLAARAGNRRAEQAFEFAEGANRAQRDLFETAVASAAQGRDLPPAEYLLCRVCGYLQEGAPPPEFCPVCGSPAQVFAPVL